MKGYLCDYIFSVLNKLSYKYELFYRLKSFFYPIKYFFLGKTDIAWVIDEIKKSRRKDNPVKIIFDVGAASGEKTLLFLKVFSESFVYAFEPQKESLEKFKKRTRAFGNRVRIFDFGFLNKNGTALLNIAPYRDASSIVPWYECSGAKKENIKILRMDDFVRQEKINHIDFIKIDVEGAEREVLEGGVDTFRNKVDNVFIEILPLWRGVRSSHFLDIFNFFHNNGFTFIGCYGDYLFSKDKYFLDNISKKWRKI